MIDKIKKLLVTDFERELFQAALTNLYDEGNKLRYNNFAYSIRELSRHILHNLAPDVNIKLCNWYVKPSDEDIPTRGQRMKYAIQGGLSDDNLEDLGFDLDDQKDAIKNLKKTIGSLSKYTHVNPEYFNPEDSVVLQMSEKVLLAFESFAQQIGTYRQDLKDMIDDVIDDTMIDSIISNYYGNVDSIAPHFTINYHEIAEHHVTEIKHDEIIVEVFGNLYFTLEYGSKKERREGDGLDLEECFPFETKIRYEISSDFPSELYSVDQFDVDTSSWYGEEE